MTVGIIFLSISTFSNTVDFYFIISFLGRLILQAI